MSDKARASELCRGRPVVAALVAVLIGVAAAVSVPVRAGEVFASVGTGEPNGVYYPVGKAICQMVNRDFSMHRVRCSPEATPGSVYNIGALRSGELEFAIVQSDVHFAAYKGEGAWIGRPFPGLRSVMSLYPELVTVMARADLHIQDLAGLAGKRINIGSRGHRHPNNLGSPRSGTRLARPERVLPAELKADATTSALCSGTIDASLLIVGHPSPLVKDQLAACPVNFVTMTGPAIEKLLHENLYYKHETIPGEIYGIVGEIPTFGGRASLVTSAGIDPRVVDVVAKAVLNHLAELRSLHPALGRLRPRDMIRDGLTAPLHPGAERVYKELGLIE